MSRNMFRKFGFKKRKRNRRGATAVEFIFVLPAFLALIFICCEVARLCMLRNLAQNACYEAARFAMTDGSTVQDGIDKANQILGRLGPNNATVSINGYDGDGAVENEIDYQTQVVTCQIEMLIRDNTLLLPGIFLGDAKIRTGMTVRTERYRGYYDGHSVD